MTECLDEDTILSFCRGGIAPERRAGIEQHIGECDECRALISAVARSSLVEPKELVADPAMAPTTPAPGAAHKLGFGSGGSGRGGGGSGGSSSSPSGPVSAPVRAGDVLAGKYSVERVLGMGGMGVVVAARHTQLDQRFALKFLLPSACEASDAIARFLREGKAAASITSEHVVRVVDTGVLENGSPYLVMEYLEGSDLGAVMAEAGPLPADHAVELVLQACEAIVEAHQLGIVHRDLKPANLFLSRRKDGSPLVKVLDFGISKSDGGSRSHLTSTSVLMGSPRYMSPEQMVSAKDVDARTDVWALGVILYELVTSKPVWHADTVQGLCALIASATAPRLRERAPNAPEILEDVIARCLAKSPDQRIASVADLAMELEPIAPESARVSIDRILRVAGRTRNAAPAVRSVPPPPTISAVTSSTAASPSLSSSSRTLVVLLAAAIGALVIAGLALNVVARPRRGGAATSAELPPPPPPPIATASITIDPSATGAAAPPITPAQLPPAASTESAPLAATTPPPKIGQPRPRQNPGSGTTARAATTASSAPSPPAPTPTDAPNRALTDRK